jgi:Rrf2 family protein
VHLSAKSDYALRALVHLAALYSGAATEPLSIRLLAEKNDIPKRFLEQIMIELRTCGWVKSLPGRDGGFVLAKHPDLITMGQVVRHFEGSLAPIGCVSSTKYHPCSQQNCCRFRRVLLEIRNFTAAKLDEATLSLVLSGPIVKHEEVLSEYYYADGAGI